VAGVSRSGAEGFGQVVRILTTRNPMKTYLKQAAFVLAVIAAAKLVKSSVTLPSSVSGLLP